MSTGCSSLPPRSWHRQERSSGRPRFSFSFVSSLCHFLGALYTFLGQAWAEGRGKLAPCRYTRTAAGNRTVHMGARPSS